ncbi:MAG: hypothetical protein WD356_07360 [Pseudomonadales bacterium]
MATPKLIKPANIILDLLRTYPERGTSARKIMAAGELFGLNENIMRVNLSRLVTRGFIDNFKRGYYRLTDRADPLSDFVEEWRLGEARKRPWDGDSWLFVHSESETGDRRHWALHSTGFRMIQAHLWMRPDNLAIDHHSLEQRLTDLGTPEPFVLVSGGKVTEDWCRQWIRCVDVEKLTRQCRAMTKNLEDSLDNLVKISRQEAMIETFNTGGAAIQMLAKDPLLPDPMQDPAPRIRLWELMREYDRAGRDIWAGKDTNIPDATPVSQTAVA